MSLWHKNFGLFSPFPLFIYFLALEGSGLKPPLSCFQNSISLSKKSHLLPSRARDHGTLSHLVTTICKQFPISSPWLLETCISPSIIPSLHDRLGAPRAHSTLLLFLLKIDRAQPEYVLHPGFAQSCSNNLEPFCEARLCLALVIIIENTIFSQ